MSNNWSREQLGQVLGRGHHTANVPGLPPAAPQAPATGSKLGNHPTEYAGVRYDSKAEACYARDLDLKVRAGLVLRWERQVVFELAVGDCLICRYVLDFRVHLPDGRVEHIDVKGRRAGGPYQLFRVKQKLMAALLGIEVLERS